MGSYCKYILRIWMSYFVLIVLVKKDAAGGVKLWEITKGAVVADFGKVIRLAMILLIINVFPVNPWTALY